MQGFYKEKKGWTYRTLVRCGLEADRPTSGEVGELFFATDTLKMYIFIGIGSPGADGSGWFNLKNAQYSS